MTSFAEQLRPFEEAARRMQGWQFEYLPENLGGDVPWNYEALASDLLKAADAVVDLGTGGGEVFSRLLEPVNCSAYATEEWQPNAPVAASRLEQVALVTRCSSLQLPFSNNSFDLVLARHEAVDPSEVVRVLRPGGVFLSQQVIHDFMFELKNYFSDSVIFPDFIKEYKDSFLELGMNISRTEEFRYKIRFKELGHLVYQLVVAPWTVPGFSVDTHLEGLKLLDAHLKNGGDLDFAAGYYLLEVTEGR